MMKHKCEKCGQDITAAPTYLDAAGQEFNVCNVLLYMKPVYSLDINGVQVSARKEITTEPITVLPNEISVDVSTGGYVMKASLFSPYSICCDEYVIGGVCGEKNPHVYKIADSVEDLL